MLEGYNEKSDNKSKIRDRIISSTSIIRFGERLKQAMNGMTNVELAKRTGMSEATIRKYIAGKIFPTIDSLAIVADACGVSFAWLAFGDTQEQNNNHGNNVLKDDFDKELLMAFNRLSTEERELIVNYIYREGINNLVRIAANHSSSISNEAMTSIIDTLPLRPLLKNAIKIGLQNNGEFDREILRFLEGIESNSQKDELNKTNVG
ncbi:helix-turn-helix domain-containing protein [Proteus mirabilis]|uniref:helix-turn-helix domain-containing protein n=1 Tax=Proteus mirabilis TaxID=584 RepID=UPI003F1A859F